jgi:hypothetical protein
MTGQLFTADQAPRRRRIVRMHVADAGSDGARPMLAEFKCNKCGHNSGWIECPPLTQAKRGLPCPICNPAEAARLS